jgi:hypothetical protein
MDGATTVSETGVNAVPATGDEVVRMRERRRPGLDLTPA